MRYCKRYTNQTLIFLFMAFTLSCCGGSKDGDKPSAEDSPSSGTSEFLFVWPVNGANGKEWVINNYYDLDRDKGSTRDYTGATGADAKVYDQHAGIDIDCSSFRNMDNNYPINAAADGVVEDFGDANFDRNNQCSSNCGSWNYVTVLHPNGWRTIYGHLKKKSVVVSVGENVVAGQKLAVMGSSGNSSQPHLHFKITNSNGDIIAPFNDGLWKNPPPYKTPFSIMDMNLQKGAIPSSKEIIDPPDNIFFAKPGEELGFGLSMSGGDVGDKLRIDVIRKDGTLHSSTAIDHNKTFRHIYRKHNFTPDDVPGKWRVDVYLNDILGDSYPFYVTNVPRGLKQQVRHGVLSSSYQKEFDDITAAGYWPVWVDGYDYKGNTYFNAIFETASQGKWAAYHDLTSAQYQNIFDEKIDAGYRLYNIDSYINNGLKIAAIFLKGSGAYAAYHFTTTANHQVLFDDYTSKGYRPVNLSYIYYGGEAYVTGFYDKANVGSFVALGGLSSSSYQREFDNNKGSGRRLSYLNGYNAGGRARFTAIWNQTPTGAYVARHNITASEFQSEFDKQSAQGYKTKIVTGYESSGSMLFGALWVK